MPPIPLIDARSLDRDFEKFLATDLTVKPEDSPEVAADKEYMAWMRLYMEEAKKGGMTPAEFLREMEALRQEEAEEIRVAMQLYREIFDQKPAEARKALKELNELLAERGLPPLNPTQGPAPAARP